MAQQTAVEWLIENLMKLDKELDGRRKNEDATVLKLNPTKIYERAKQMHKEQTKAAYNKGYQDGEIDSLDAKDGDVQFFEDAEQYYNETYGKSI
jgi:hypothetical protein